MTAVAIAGAVWLAVAALVGVTVGRAIRIADEVEGCRPHAEAGAA